MQSSIRLLVFDWDGTLLDSIGSIVACVQATLEELGEPAAEEERIRASIGLGLRETVEMFRPDCGDELFDRVVNVYRRLWTESFCRVPHLFAEVPEVLEKLRNDGYRLAIATAKSRGGLRHDLERTGLGGLFHSTRTIDEAPSKPNPQMLLDILLEQGVGQQESLMIGDTVHDLEMAANAGVRSVAVLSGCESREVLEPWQPVACLRSVTELVTWLDGDRETSVCPNPGR
jgi:phosphoglycolate phosphatase